LINFAAIHTTAIGFTQIFYDLATIGFESTSAQMDLTLCDDSPSTIIDMLRQEILTNLPDVSTADRKSLQSLVHLEAFIKESMRMHLNACAVMPRCVLADEGYTTKDGRLFFPKGSVLAVPGRMISFDKRFWDDPQRHNYLRYGRLANDGSNSNEKGQNIEESERRNTVKSQDRYVATSTDEYLAFGAGKHVWYALVYFQLHVIIMSPACSKR